MIVEIIAAVLEHKQPVLYLVVNRLITGLGNCMNQLPKCQIGEWRGQPSYRDPIRVEMAWIRRRCGVYAPLRASMKRRSCSLMDSHSIPTTLDCRACILMMGNAVPVCTGQLVHSRRHIASARMT